MKVKKQEVILKIGKGRFLKEKIQAKKVRPWTQFLAEYRDSLWEYKNYWDCD